MATKLKKRFGILSGGGFIHHEADSITDDMRHYLQVNPTAVLIRRSTIGHLGYVQVPL